MSEAFNLNHGTFAGDARFASIARELGSQSRIDSTETFNNYCRKACQLWDKKFDDAPFGQRPIQFDDLLARIEQGGKDVIRTSWGGVVITRHEHPRMEKFLVVRKGGYLALEKHEEKDEHIEVKEGAGLVLWRSLPNESLIVEILEPGKQLHFEPGVEHCLIGTENLLVFERSTDPKGMDQDLIFIYQPDGREVAMR